MTTAKEQAIQLHRERLPAHIQRVIAERDRLYNLMQEKQLRLDALNAEIIAHCRNRNNKHATR